MLDYCYIELAIHAFALLLPYYRLQMNGYKLQIIHTNWPTRVGIDARVLLVP